MHVVQQELCVKIHVLYYMYMYGHKCAHVMGKRKGGGKRTGMDEIGRK